MKIERKISKYGDVEVLIDDAIAYKNGVNDISSYALQNATYKISRKYTRTTSESGSQGVFSESSNVYLFFGNHRIDCKSQKFCWQNTPVSEILEILTARIKYVRSEIAKLRDTVEYAENDLRYVD